MRPVSDRFAQWDAAYVLGALSPADRQEFEEHLAGCPGCQAAVAEVAGLPGLLAQVTIEDATRWSPPAPDSPGSPVPLDPPPASWWPAVVATLRSRRRRTVSWLAVAAVLIVLGGLVGSGVLPIGPAQARRLAFTPVAPSSLTALVDVVPVREGTRIQVECQYAEVDPRSGDPAAEYSIVVVDRAGRTVDVKDWQVKPTKVMRPQGVTSLRPGQIRRIEIRRSATGETLLQAVLR